jgi:hypothetical protein
VLGLTRIGVGLLGAEPGGLGLLTGLEAAKSLLEAAHYREERSDLKELLASLGRRFPLAWLAGVYRRERNGARRAPRPSRDSA